MGIFDALTGNAGHEAASNQRFALSSIIPNLATSGQTAFNQARSDLTGGFGQARTDLGQGYDAATGAINRGATGALGYLDQGQQGALGQLGQARGDLTANGGAFAPLSALASQYGAGANMYGNAVGLNGAAGNAAAQSAFNAGPGYQFQLDQGLDAINRRRNAGGMLGSGNADRDAQVFGQGLANQSYQQWLSNLAPYNNLQLSATQGAAAGNQANNQSLANLGIAGAQLANITGRSQAGIAQGQGGSLADLARAYYGGLGGLDTGGAAALAANTIGANANNQGLFLNGLNQWNDTQKQDAAASNAASANSLGLGMNLAKLGISAFGGGGFGGGGGSSFLPSSSFLQNGMNWG